MTAPTEPQRSDRSRPVTRRDIVVRGLLHRCPNCGRPGVFRGLFKTNERCENCDFLIQREDGFFLGAIAINYAAAAAPLIVIFVLIFMNAISVPVALAIAIPWTIVVPILFYRTSKSLWLMLVYLFMLRDLPANRAAALKEAMDAESRSGSSTKS
jgi:uncharacterized protein (DUF983 family)